MKSSHKQQLSWSKCQPTSPNGSTDTLIRIKLANHVGSAIYATLSFLITPGEHKNPFGVASWRASGVKIRQIKHVELETVATLSEQGSSLSNNCCTSASLCATHLHHSFPSDAVPDFSFLLGHLAAALTASIIPINAHHRLRNYPSPFLVLTKLLVARFKLHTINVSLRKHWKCLCQSQETVGQKHPAFNLLHSPNPFVIICEVYCTDTTLEQKYHSENMPDTHPIVYNKYRFPKK